MLFLCLSKRDKLVFTNGKASKEDLEKVRTKSRLINPILGFGNSEALKTERIEQERDNNIQK